MVGDFFVQRVIEVGRREERLDRDEHCSDLESGAPLVLEDVKADSADLVNVGVVDLGSEEHLGRDHRVLVREEELGVEHASFVRSTVGASNLHMEVSEVSLVGFSVDSDNYNS